MQNVRDILFAINRAIPPSLAESWDNSGFLVGDPEDTVTRVLLSLDITVQSVEEASLLGCNLIVSHHPVIFDPIKSVTGDGEGMVVSKLLRKNINAICVHTPLDAVSGGVNDVLAETLGLASCVPLNKLDGVGRIGVLSKSVPFEQFADEMKAKLQTPVLLCHKEKDDVKRAAVVGGSGDDYMDLAFEAGCDTFVTGDLKHHMLVHAANLGINVLCAGHFHTEVIGMRRIEQILNDVFAEIKVYHSSSQYRMYTVL